MHGIDASNSFFPTPPTKAFIPSTKIRPCGKHLSHWTRPLPFFCFWNDPKMEPFEYLLDAGWDSYDVHPTTHRQIKKKESFERTRAPFEKQNLWFKLASAHTSKLETSGASTRRRFSTSEKVSSYYARRDGKGRRQRWMQRVLPLPVRRGLVGEFVQPLRHDLLLSMSLLLRLSGCESHDERRPRTRRKRSVHLADERT